MSSLTNEEESGFSPIDTQQLMLWCLALGVFGVHRFVMGKPLSGLLMLVTLGGMGFWVLIDLIWISFIGATDGKGRRIRTWPQTLRNDFKDVKKDLNEIKEDWGEVRKSWSELKEERASARGEHRNKKVIAPSVDDSVAYTLEHGTLKENGMGGGNIGTFKDMNLALNEAHRVMELDWVTYAQVKDKNGNILLNLGNKPAR